MIDTKALKGIIVAHGDSQKDAAIALGMTPKTFYSKMKNGVFGTDDVEKLIERYDITEPMKIFFTNRVTL